jgi:hypothetical protein
MDKTIWYKKIGSDDSLIVDAIAIARASGSIGATETYLDADRKVLKTATVMREGFQDSDYVLI